MAESWWQRHRLLQRGARGPDVERLQQALNRIGTSPPLKPNGEFGPNTEQAVLRFQEMMKLVVDGKVGPVTHSVLFGEDFRIELHRPPWVREGTEDLCWAASLESVLKSAWPGRPHLTVRDLQSRYSSYLSRNGAINVPGFLQVGSDLRFREILRGEHVRAERLIGALRSRLPLLLVDNSTGVIMHTRVLYGVQISRGAIDLLLMDPLSWQEHVRVPIGMIQALTRIGVVAPNEISPE